jgi:hypothetical protein
MLWNPRYGVIGLVAMPYFLLFELLGSLLEVTGLFIVATAWLLGLVSLEFLLAFTFISILVLILLSFSAILLEEYAIRRYERGRDIARLVLYSLFETFGYRQLVAVWRCLAFVDLARGRKDWGTMQRRGLERPAEAPLPERATRA